MTNSNDSLIDSYRSLIATHERLIADHERLTGDYERCLNQLEQAQQHATPEPVGQPMPESLDCREAFEKRFKGHYHLIKSQVDGEYCNSLTRTLWDGWKAAWDANLPAAPVQQSGEVEDSAVYNAITRLCSMSSGSLGQLIPSQRIQLAKAALAAMGRTESPNMQAVAETLREAEGVILSAKMRAAGETPYYDGLLARLHDAANAVRGSEISETAPLSDIRDGAISETTPAPVMGGAKPDDQVPLVRTMAVASPATQQPVAMPTVRDENIASLSNSNFYKLSSAKRKNGQPVGFTEEQILDILAHRFRSDGFKKETADRLARVAYADGLPQPRLPEWEAAWNHKRTAAHSSEERYINEQLWKEAVELDHDLYLILDPKYDSRRNTALFRERHDRTLRALVAICLFGKPEHVAAASTKRDDAALEKLLDDLGYEANTTAHEHGSEQARANMRKLLSHFLRLPERESGWQPIETAPRDGSSILTFTNRVSHGFMIHYWGRSESNNPMGWLTHPNSTHHIDQPTHWMPLPDEPNHWRKS